MTTPVVLTEGTGHQVDTVATATSNDDGVGGTTLGYEIVTAPGSSFFTINANGKISYIGGADYEATNIGLKVENAGQANEKKYFELQVRAKESGATGQTSGITTVKVYLDDVNEAPKAINLTNEQTITAGTTGANANVVKATWTDEDTRAAFTANNKYGFLVGGQILLSDGKFTINKDTGQITTNDVINSTADGKTLTIIAYDEANNTLRFTQTKQITVNAQDNQPPQTPTVTTPVVLTEGTGHQVDTVATATSNDDGVGGTTLGYEIVTAPGSSFFTINANGKISYIGGADYEATNIGLKVENAGQANEKKYFELQVRAKESGATGQTSGITTVKVYLDDMNEAPKDIVYTNAQTITVGTAKDANVVKATWVDDDTRDAFDNNEYGFLVGGQIALSDGKFTINKDTGQITTNGVINAATDGKTLTVVAYDSTTNTLRYTRDYEVTVGATANSAPKDLQLNGGTVVSINENDAFTGNLSADDDNDDTDFDWIFDNTVVGNDNSLFEIDNSGTGNKKLKLKAGVNFEDLSEARKNADGTKSVKVYLKADDGKPNGLSATQAFEIKVSDVNEGPDNIKLNGATSVTIAENTQTNTEVGTLTAHDPEGKSVTYSLGSSADGRFMLDATKTKILVADGAKLDWDVLPNGQKYYDITVVATDADNKSSEQVIRINLTDDPSDNPTPTNQGPSAPVLSGNTASEYAAAGTLVGTLAATDPNGDSLSYSLTNTAEGRFKIAGNQILVADGFRLDFEQAKAHTVTVQVSDGKGGLSTQTFAINVGDVTREITAGSTANDVFKAGKYNDKLGGGLGNDKLWGGLGNDQLTGGKGKDTFVFDTKLNKSKNKDLIKDYSVKDDTLWLDNALFKANKALYAATKKGTEKKPLKMASKFFSLDTAKDKDDFFVYDSHKRVLYYDADGSGSKAGVAIATFTNNKALKNFSYKEILFI
ncbi:Ig-like domain-containing protein [Microvirga rosea]|uniref:Ig-like domain-containing protein n=1 Tax=Microvirga rosea TaxID=2715425 RepID=UPI0029CAC49C|nr:hypothetical protein [Microvirga rosea]